MIWIWIAFAGLCVVVVAHTVALLGLYNHFGTMYYSSPNGRRSQGPDPDVPLELFEVKLLDAGGARFPRPDRPLLLMFASTNCHICHTLFPLVRLTDPAIDTLVLFAGDERDVRRLASDLAGVFVVWDQDFQIAARFGVATTPFLVAVDAKRRVRAAGNVSDDVGFHAIENHCLTGSGRPGTPHDHHSSTVSVVTEEQEPWR